MLTKMAAARMRTSGLIPALIAATLAATAGRAEAQPGAAGRVGQALDNAGRGIRSGVQNAFARTRNAVHDQEVIARVYSRLHWDKTLTGSTLELEVQGPGIAILRGAVPDAAAKERAVVLTRDTVGVVEVIDELVVAAPASTPPATLTPSSTTAPVVTPSRPSSTTITTPSLPGVPSTTTTIRSTPTGSTSTTTTTP